MNGAREVAAGGKAPSGKVKRVRCGRQEGVQQTESEKRQWQWQRYNKCRRWMSQGTKNSQTVWIDQSLGAILNCKSEVFKG